MFDRRSASVSVHQMMCQESVRSSSEEISRLMDEYEKQKEGAEENSEEQQKK